MPLVVVAPVTPNVPPTVALLVTAALLSVARPVVERVPVPTLPVLVMPLVVVAPVTPNVPPMVAVPELVKLPVLDSKPVLPKPLVVV